MEKDILIRKCSSCKIELDIKFFNKRKDNYYASVCTPCSVNNYRETYLFNKYGITLVDYEHLLKEQDYKCDICRLPNLNGYRLCVDHCHITGNIRGLLCLSCNSALGKFKDNLILLHKAIEYLKKYEK